MIGVRFNTPVSPYGIGDIAMVPEDVAERLEKSGEASLYELPAQPHAHEAGYQPPVTKPMTPAGKPRQTLLTKRGA